MSDRKRSPRINRQEAEYRRTRMTENGQESDKDGRPSRTESVLLYREKKVGRRRYAELGRVHSPGVYVGDPAHAIAWRIKSRYLSRPPAPVIIRDADGNEIRRIVFDPDGVQRVVQPEQG